MIYKVIISCFVTGELCQPVHSGLLLFLIAALFENVKMGSLHQILTNFNEFSAIVEFRCPKLAAYPHFWAKNKAVVCLNIAKQSGISISPTENRHCRDAGNCAFSNIFR
jgi:hypothetical protein